MSVAIGLPMSGHEDTDWDGGYVFSYYRPDRLVAGSLRAQRLYAEWAPRHTDKRALCYSLYLFDHPADGTEGKWLARWQATYLFAITLGNSELGEGYELIVQRLLSLKLELIEAASEAEEAALDAEVAELLTQLEWTEAVNEWVELEFC